jgi:hypothetical protein
MTLLFVPSISLLFAQIHCPLGGTAITQPKIRRGNLTVTTLLAKCRAVMLPYDFVNRSYRNPVDIPLAAQLLTISGIIPGLLPFGWVQTGIPQA